LVTIDTTANYPILIKEDKHKTQEYDTFQKSVEVFLKDVEAYPTVAVIGIAGPISDNSVFLANVEKWGTLDGYQLGKNLNIPNFIFLNDF